MDVKAATGLFTSVALRKESVDRNNRNIANSKRQKKSLSARRAWIEIGRTSTTARRSPRRSPQGERG